MNRKRKDGDCSWLILLKINGSSLSGKFTDFHQSVYNLSILLLQVLSKFLFRFLTLFLGEQNMLQASAFPFKSAFTNFALLCFALRFKFRLYKKSLCFLKGENRIIINVNVSKVSDSQRLLLG